MNPCSTNKYNYTEADVQEAILAYKLGNYPSVRSAAIAFGVPSTTLHNRMAGQRTRQKSHEHPQILSDSE